MTTRKPSPTKQKLAPRKLRASKSKKPPGNANNKSSARLAKPSSKQETVLSMLRQANGATTAAIVKATGWQQHSVRGFFAGIVKRKFKLALESEKAGNDRIYRIAKPGVAR